VGGQISSPPGGPWFATEVLVGRLAMKIINLCKEIRGLEAAARLEEMWGSLPNEATQRYQWVLFMKKHGVQAAMDAFGVSRRTLFRLQSLLNRSGWDPRVLIPQSRAPHRRRQSNVSKAVVKKIRELREEFPNLGKAKVRVLLEPWCAEQGIPCPSESTIGRIISRAPDKMRVVPTRLDSKGRRKTIQRPRRLRKPKQLNSPPLSLWAVDTIERVRDGIRRYIITFFDPVSRIGLAFAAPSTSSKNTSLALNALLSCLLSKDPHSCQLAILSDNGSEFLKDFDKSLRSHQITHYFTYPKHPKMNAHCERFNRTIQDLFVDYHEDLLFSDLPAFNQKLAHWLIKYNTIIPHHGIDLLSPVQWLMKHHPECQMYWTKTQA